MPKLQFLTAHLVDGDGKVMTECVPKSLYSCKRMTVGCSMPTSGVFSVRLSSGPLPFDTVVKLSLNGTFLAGRCFLSGSVEPLFEYYIHRSSHLTPLRQPLGFPFVRPCSKIQISVHKCVVDHPTSAQTNGSLLTRTRDEDGPTPEAVEESVAAPVIIREEKEPRLEIVWECRARHPAP